VGWGTGVKGRDVVTSCILPRVFFKKPVTQVVTRRDVPSPGAKRLVQDKRAEASGARRMAIE
jgi:hypothetical protein